MTLDEIRALDAAATPGPWQCLDIGPTELHMPGPVKWSKITKAADAAFIVAARSLLLPLAERVAELERDVSDEHQYMLNWKSNAQAATARAEAAKERNAKLEAVAKAAGPAEKDTYGRGFRIMCDDSCGCPQCQLRDALAALAALAKA